MQERISANLCLTDTLTQSLCRLEKHILNFQCQIETWFREEWQKTPPPFYGSVDLRNAGFKLAPVDTNLFPAGFNNLNPDFLPLCIQAIQATFEKYQPLCQKILLIPENHTRNTYYFENLATLYDLLTKAGFDVHIGSLLPDIKSPLPVALPSQRTLMLEPLLRENNRLKTQNFDPDLILLNNDLAEGIPPILQNLDQPVWPPSAMGWSTRLKSKHFTHYQTVSEEFSQLINIDSWYLAPAFTTCNEVDFVEGTGEDCLIANTKKIYQLIKDKYALLKIDKKPFVVIKAESGTYGMGVMTLDDPEIIRTLSRKERAKMAVTKGGQKINRVIIQEGVYTFETVDDAVAEPVIYLIGQHVVGGFYRVHTKRSANENLNSPGMHFKPLAFDCPCNMPNIEDQIDCKVNRFYVYGVIARLALLAAAREIGELK